MNAQPAAEPIIEPALPIIDAHHHLWWAADAQMADLDKDDSEYSKLTMQSFRHHQRYLLEEFLADINTGHNVRATVYVEAHAMYRQKGPPGMKSVGEVEFANGLAAMAASGRFGPTLVNAGIIGCVDFRGLGDKSREVLEAQMRAGGDRYRGIRTILMYDEDTNVLTHKYANTPHIARDANFRAGFKHLEPLGLSFDSWMLEPQLPELIELVQAFPGTKVIVCHTGGPVGLGRFKGTHAERFPIWRESIRTLAKSPNVYMKLGGLGMPSTGFKTSCNKTPPSSEALAQDWKPYIETSIEAFGADRCMFESNFPPDAGTAGYAVTWNAFKRTVSGASAAEKAALFGGTAKRVYNLDVDLT